MGHFDKDRFASRRLLFLLLLDRLYGFLDDVWLTGKFWGSAL